MARWLQKIGSIRNPSPSTRLSLHADNLKRMNDLDQIGLSRHQRLNRLVRRGFSSITPASLRHSMRRHALVIRHGESPLRSLRHRAARSVAATRETLRVFLATHDVGTRSYAADVEVLAALREIREIRSGR